MYKTPHGYIERPRDIVWENPLPLLYGNTIIGQGTFDGENTDFEIRIKPGVSLNVTKDNIEPEPYGFASKWDADNNPLEFKIKCLYADKTTDRE